MTHLNQDKIIKYLRLEDITLLNKESKDMQVGLIVDTETTGLKSSSEIIQISMLLFEFDDSTYEINKIIGKYTSYNEVNAIPEVITKLTGITVDDVKGHKINWGKVHKAFQRADVIIAHNAKFDRGVLEHNYPPLANLDSIWLCSAFDPSYEDYFINSSILDYVLFRLGFWFDHHSAEEDVIAVLRILTSNFPDSNINIFANIIDNVFKDTFIVEVYDTDFHEKDILKNEGYRWNPDNKCWWIKSENTEETDNWLRDNLSHYRINILIEKIEDRYKNK